MASSTGIRPGFRPGTFITQPPPTPNARAPPTPSARGLPLSDRGLAPTPSARALPNLDELIRKRASEELAPAETAEAQPAGVRHMLSQAEEISLRFEPGPGGTLLLSVRRLDDGTFEVDCQSEERLARLLSRTPTSEDAPSWSWTPEVLAEFAIGARSFLWGAGVGAFLLGAASAIRTLRRA